MNFMLGASVKYVLIGYLVCLFSCAYGVEIVGNRGAIGVMSLPDGYVLELLPGKNNQDMLVLKDSKQSKVFLFIDYDGLNPHQYIIGDVVRIGKISWVYDRSRGVYSGIIDGNEKYLSFELSEFQRTDMPIVVSLLNSIEIR